ncbi:hypothetical protein BOX15_Mlig020091g1 [Macrostomum lignano]|uniref:Uncharacterized protein n=1 Tax=Macrostomum lignano TaxID=282301 RepID=A0A267EG13_9PLAT|nr:hypothetical protein BOX15_Mlig020091g1 [Macrostomum lignano]
MFAIFGCQVVHPTESETDIDDTVSRPSATTSIVNNSTLEAETNRESNSDGDSSSGSQLESKVIVHLPDGGVAQLHCLATSVDAPLVERLANQVRRKLGSSGPQALAGTTDMLDWSDPDGSGQKLAVFFCFDSDYLVCLLDSSLQKLDAFHDQLLDYVREQVPGFVAGAADPAAAASAAFAVWEEATVASLQRTVKLLRGVLPQLVTLVSVGCRLTVECATEDDFARRREVERFIGQCRLMDNAPSAVAASAGGADATEAAWEEFFPQSAVLRINGRSVSLDFAHCTEFAKTWSAALLDSVDDENPVRLRQRILDLRLRASRDVNATKRLLADAVCDYYALYRLAQMLRQTGNGPVLLHSLWSLGSPEERELLQFLRTALAPTCPLLSCSRAPLLSATDSAAAAAASATDQR